MLVLCFLATFDNLLLLCTFFLFSLPTWSSTYSVSVFPLMVPYLYPMTNTFMTCSIYMTVSVAINRFLDMASYANRIPRIKSGTCQALMVFAVSVIVNIPRWFEFKSQYTYQSRNITNADNVTVLTNVTILTVKLTDLRQNDAYIRDYTLITNSVLMVGLPTLFMLISSVLIYRQMVVATRSISFSDSQDQLRKRRNRNITFVLIGIIVLFLCCHIGEIAISIYELTDLLDGERSDFPMWAKNVVTMNHLLVVINSSLNFVIYCKDVVFRECALMLYRRFKISSKLTAAAAAANGVVVIHSNPVDAHLELLRINRDLGISLQGDPNAEVVLKDLDPQSRILCGINSNV